MIDGLKLAVTGEEHAKLLERLSKVAGEMTAAHFAPLLRNQAWPSSESSSRLRCVHGRPSIAHHPVVPCKAERT
jgi:hypothetical protein